MGHFIFEEFKAMRSTLHPDKLTADYLAQKGEFSVFAEISRQDRLERIYQKKRRG